MVDPDIEAMEARRREANVPARDVQQKAGVSSATWWSWFNASAEPKKSTIRRVNEALDSLIAERAQA